jgi:hypothetical protein
MAPQTQTVTLDGVPDPQTTALLSLQHGKTAQPQTLCWRATHSVTPLAVVAASRTTHLGPSSGHARAARPAAVAAPFLGLPYRATTVSTITDLTAQSAQRDPPASRIQTAWQCTMIRVTTRGPIICVMQGTRILSVLPAAVYISRSQITHRASYRALLVAHAICVHWMRRSSA